MTTSLSQKKDVTPVRESTSVDSTGSSYCSVDSVQSSIRRIKSITVKAIVNVNLQNQKAKLQSSKTANRTGLRRVNKAICTVGLSEQNSGSFISPPPKVKQKSSKRNAILCNERSSLCIFPVLKLTKARDRIVWQDKGDCSDAESFRYSTDEEW